MTGFDAVAGRPVRTSRFLTVDRAVTVYRRPFVVRLLAGGRMTDVQSRTEPARHALILPDGSIIVHPAMISWIDGLREEEP